MSLLTRVLNFFRKASLEREFDEELRFHLERRIERNREQGMNQVEAEAAASRRFGSLNRTKRDMQEVRVMRKSIAVAVLAGGVALCVAVGTLLWFRTRAIQAAALLRND